ncbi:MAG: MMPL family transporter, partial [Gemmatimonadetes bacterium]|nr:MMPL family transporter [Gemmatimonadota bacterium]
SIGIIVDDTVHFLSKYTHARQEKGLDAAGAVGYAFRTVGTAILGTTFIVAIGFAMLGLSTFRVTSYMGLLTSLTVACALVIDFLLLPALLLTFDRRKTEAPASDLTAARAAAL